MLAGVDAGKQMCIPFVLLSTEATLAQQLQCARVFVAERCTPTQNRRPLVKKGVGEKVRIGYFSSDFKLHPVGILMENLLEKHDHSAFELYGYFLNSKTQDDIERSITKRFNQSYDLFGLTDQSAYELIASHQLDIAVDLNGHTSGARTALFAARLAPIQVNYLGYAGTSGADFFDYLIADDCVIPPQHHAFYTEKIAYLPHSFFPVDTTIRDFGPLPSRPSQHLPEKAFVFCCFNNAYKIQSAIFSRWMDLLKSVEGSVLWLSKPSEKAISNLRNEALRHGVDASRIIFASRVPARIDHLSRLRLADLFLDTPNYNAHATCADALWAGVPVLTQIGRTFAGRVAASQLNALGINELITDTADAYQIMALDLAQNSDKLQQIRERLIENSKTYPLFNSQEYVQNLEACYRNLLAQA